MAENISFRRWLWDALYLPGALRSDRRKRLGTFLLFTNILWLFAPIAITVKALLMMSQAIVGVALVLHGHYLVGQEWEERLYLVTREDKKRKEETLKQARIDIIKLIADRDGVSLEEAEQTMEDMERWVREAREKAANEVLDGLELAMVKGNIQVIEMDAERLGISINEATEKFMKAKRIRIAANKPLFGTKDEEAQSSEQKPEKEREVE